MTNCKMLVEQDQHRARVAILEDDRLSELFIERHGERGVVGNIYKGRVHRVLPGMQAAFVDIGLERDAFLYVREVRDDVDRLLDEELSDAHAVLGSPDAASEPETAVHPSIDDLLSVGQELVVQVLKDPLPNKGARVTTHITLPGRYLVFLPTQSHLGISRRISDEEERERLLGELEALTDDQPGGLIVRTAGEGLGGGAFARDRDYLTALWSRLRRRAEISAAPGLVHRDLDLPLRVVRDRFSDDYGVLWVEGEETYERIVHFLDEVQPELVAKVRLHGDHRSLYERYGIEEAIEEALEAKVWLKSGGYIVIHPTEALVAIDVNTGRFVGKRDLATTILTTNLEAVREIVRQVRLRNLGGIIVIDLIDMADEEHQAEVFGVLEAELARDHAKNKVLSISEFGLVEITRKRTRASLEKVLTQPCPHCRGTGHIRSMGSICLAIRKEVLQWASRGVDQIVLRVHPKVAEALQRREAAILDELEVALGNPPILESDPLQHHESFDLVEV